jgi:hypothetical protein
MNSNESEGVSPKEYELLPLPAVHQTRFAFLASVVGTVLLLIVTVVFWIVDAPPKLGQDIARQNIDRVSVRAQEKHIARFNMLKYFILPLLCVLTVTGIFSNRIEFRVDEDGIEVRYFLRSSYYSWRELRTAKVVIAKVVVNHVARYHHSLAVVPRHGQPIEVALGDESYRWRDTIFAAAQSAGRSIELDEQDPGR